MNRRITKIIAIIAVVAMLASFFAINVSADETTIAASGYAAIGVVDAGANKAEVLLGTGEQGTVIYAGEAPVTGGVYRYTRDENNIYTFANPEANMGNSNVNAVGDVGWPLWSSKNGWLWTSFNNEYIHFYPYNEPIFFRFGDNKWAITTIFNFEGADGASHMYGYALDSSVNYLEQNQPGALVFGLLQEGNTSNTEGFNVMVPSLTASNDLGSFTTPLHPIAEPEATEPEATEPEATEPEATEPEATEPEATEPEATEPEATEPEATEPEATDPENVYIKYSASGTVVETGYAAIGVVDESLSKVQVLLGDGKVGAVYYAGEAPVTGGVYRYELHDNNVFVFIEPTANLGNSNANTVGDVGWPLWSTKSGWLWTSFNNEYVHFFPYNEPIFFRHGDNKWDVTTIFNFEGADGASAMYGYALDSVVNSEGQNQPGAMVFGLLQDGNTCNTEGYNVMVPSLTGSKDLGTFTSDLYTPTTEGEIVNGPSKTGDVIISVLCGMIAISVIGGAVIISKKNKF